ncbi:hypothetical protein GI374_16790 [Paracoccus sp. S-4012]|uniref:sulfotransferase n=1 Tax=Paracoccus sp. S-4012 TaxID=2665648 RepID=UPI0012B0C100|nr:sulfotransferase [Paracoccus sp. S-4012]MRX52037.1 hypothetical protein [Paracoccus sp. S-4012]
MQQPQIIGFGAQKAGTSWLAANLAQNPGVWEPPMKEMHFFTFATLGHRWMLAGHREKMARLAREAEGHPARAAYIGRVREEKVLSEEWYRAVYAGCPAGKMSYDITPAYALLGDDGLDHMHRLLGGSFKAIYQIRDPASRVISSIKKLAHRRGAKPDDADFWMAQVRAPVAVERSAYRGTIQRLDAKVGDRVLYIPFRQIARDPGAVLAAVEAHCSLPVGEYRKPGEARYVSPSVEPTPAIMDDVRAELREQYEFLEARFGADFLSLI